MRLSKITFLFTFLVNISVLIAQEFTPIVKQFTKKDYGAANQNWSVSQSSDGIMYFGNNQGLLEFDGNTWNLYKLPLNKTARSLYIDTNNRIYTGSFQEFGYFEKLSTGQLNYVSLSDQLKGYEMKNDEIWQIIELNNKIIFQSFTSYFVYDGKNITGFRSPYTFLFFNKFRNDVYTHTHQFGFSKLDYLTDKAESVPDIQLKSELISILPINKQVAILVTKSAGLYYFTGNKISPLKTDADDELAKAEVNRAVLSRDGLILLGTISNGVTALTQSGRKLWTLNTSNVLQNNTVLGMFCDRNNNLWLSLDKGISLIQLSSKLRYIRSFTPSVGSIYSANYSEPYLYLGTNQGLYKTVFDINGMKLGNISLDSKIKGQVWNITKIDNQLLCGNNEETCELFPQSSKLISPVKGGMCFGKGYINGKEVVVQGTYTELCIYLKKDGKWAFSHSVENFVNPIRYLEIDYTGTIWASHLYQGLYSIKLSADLRKIDKIETFSTLDNVNKYNVNLFSVNNRVVFTDHTKFYTYDDIDKRIIPYQELNDNLGIFAQSYRIRHFKDDLYWFIRDGESALVQVKSGGCKLLDIVQNSLFQNQTVDDYQNVVPLSDDKCLFTLENGLAIYDFTEKEKSIASVKLKLKTVLTSDAEGKQNVFIPLADSAIPEIPYKRNNITLTLFFPEFSQMNNTEFRFKLNGFDKVWSEPTPTPVKTYSYLPYGKYTLHAEVVSKSGFVLGSMIYTFEVKPPFYLSMFAKVVYVLLFILLVYGGYLYIKRVFYIKKEKIHKEQEEIRRKEIEKREQQIVTLEKEKLESELTVKSKELAGSTMTIIKKNEILVTIKEELINQKGILGSQYPNKYYDKLMRMIDESLSSEDDWAIFQANFDRIHENFFRNLHVRFPELTSNDLRFCAFLRLNLTSKDIAHLMNISLKGVEVGRYRIRKKIGLPSTKSLTEFMIEFK